MKIIALITIFVVGFTLVIYGTTLYLLEMNKKRRNGKK